MKAKKTMKFVFFSDINGPDAEKTGLDTKSVNKKIAYLNYLPFHLLGNSLIDRFGFRFATKRGH